MIIFASYENFRWMFVLGLIPILILFFGLLKIPESKIWLNRSKIKTRIFVKENKIALFIAIGISIFQQITGINIAFYYAPKIFQMTTGLENKISILITISVGFIQFFMTFVFMAFIDKIGRKKILLFGLKGMTFCMLLLSFLFLFQKFSIMKVIILITYVGFYALSLGPLAWLLISEVFSNEMRGKAMGVAAACNWGANFCVSVTFLPLIQRIGFSNTFLIFSIICLFSFIFFKKILLETKNKSFEDIQKILKYDLN